MKTRAPLRILLATVMTLALLPMLSSLSPGSLLSASPAAADQVWLQSTGHTRAKKKACATGGGKAGTCVIGARGPGGGKVFYVNNAAATGSRYMEAAPNTWSGGSPPSDPTLAWGSPGGTDCANSDIAGAVGTGIGTGLANTTAITAVCTAELAPAAWAAKNYTGGGVSWFLPSRLELNQLCRYASRQPFNAAKRTCIGSATSVGGFANGFYWSSSQKVASYAWGQFFGGGGQGEDNKVNTNYVRPVRAF